MGGADYINDVPPHSVINVNDFPSVEALSTYLFYLMENPVIFSLSRQIKNTKIICQLWLLGRVPKIFRMEEKSHALRNQSLLRTLHQTSWSTRTGQDLSRHVWMVLQTSKWRFTMYRRVRKALFQVNISIVTTTISISNIFALISTAT